MDLKKQLLEECRKGFIAGIKLTFIYIAVIGWIMFLMAVFQ